MKENKKRTIGLVIGIILLLVPLVVLLIYYFSPKQVLYREIERISKIDIAKEELTMDIKSSGEYGKIEEAIKEYFIDYGKYIKECGELVSSENLDKITSEENLTNDAPNFEQTLAKIAEVKEKFNENADQLTSMMSEDAVMAKIEAKEVSQEMKDLYKELMFDADTMEQIQLQKEDLLESKQILNDILDLNEAFYTLLKENPGKWEVEDGQLKVVDNTLLERYNKIVSQLEGE